MTHQNKQVCGPKAALAGLCGSDATLELLKIIFFYCVSVEAPRSEQMLV